MAAQEGSDRVTGPSCPQLSRANATDQGQNMRQAGGLVIKVIYFIFAEHGPALAGPKTLVKSLAGPTRCSLLSAEKQAHLR